MMLGEAESKCAHLAGAPLQPAIAEQLNEIYLSKGIHGTASIEGNTLSEEQVLQRIQGTLDLPPSQAYLGVEIDNILEACNDIMWTVHEGPEQRPGELDLTPRRVKQFNKQVLAGLDLDDEDTVPGQVRAHSVGVMNYLGAPAEDCDFLLDRLCEWLEHEVVLDDPAMIFPIALLRAIVAHLYIAWIHPFGDGNGRTARLIEFLLLVRAGIPFPAAHLLSDHYNETRGEYYRVLDRTSKPPYAIEPFIDYAMQGFVDQLRIQIDVIREQQQFVTWEHYVHSHFAGQDTKARIRQRHLVLALPADQVTPSSKIRSLTPQLALEYADKQSKTVTRDVNALLHERLIVRGRGGIRPNRALIQAFLPGRAPTPTD